MRVHEHHWRRARVCQWASVQRACDFQCFRELRCSAFTQHYVAHSGLEPLAEESFVPSFSALSWIPQRRPFRPLLSGRRHPRNALVYGARPWQRGPPSQQIAVSRAVRDDLSQAIFSEPTLQGRRLTGYGAYRNSTGADCAVQSRSDGPHALVGLVGVAGMRADRIWSLPQRNRCRLCPSKPIKRLPRPRRPSRPQRRPKLTPAHSTRRMSVISPGQHQHPYQRFDDVSQEVTRVRAARLMRPCAAPHLEDARHRFGRDRAARGH